MFINKRIILPFLLLAWTIIFAHSIIPHHHHVDYFQAEHKHSHDHCIKDHENHSVENIGFSECTHDCSSNACHFHVDVLTKVSVDNIFIINQENKIFEGLSYNEIDWLRNSKEFVSEQIPKTDHLRGPPISA